MIFVDSNVPMYPIGTPHPNRDRAEAFLRSRPDEHYVTSVEVCQEILHRYVAIERREAIGDAFQLLDELAVSVLLSTRADADTAREIAERHSMLSERDCLHLAVIRVHGVERVLTFDQGFSALPGIIRFP